MSSSVLISVVTFAVIGCAILAAKGFQGRVDSECFFCISSDDHTQSHTLIRSSLQLLEWTSAPHFQWWVSSREVLFKLFRTTGEDLLCPQLYLFCRMAEVSVFIQPTSDAEMT